MKKVNKLDKEFRKLYKETCYSSNPFSFTCGQTYAWVEEEKKDKNPKKETKSGDETIQHDE